MSRESHDAGTGGPGLPGPDATGATSPPGQSFMYEAPATPPQFENGPGWSAPPLGVCGTEAYDDGEYLYQDYVYDDTGAYTGDRPFDPPQDRPAPVPNPTLVSPASGCLVYPDDAATYGYNAADLLEFRTRLTDDGVAYRLTLQTMREPAVAAVAIGIDTGEAGGTDEWGYGLGSLGVLDLDHLLVTWGTGAELDGEPVPSSVDADRNQIDVTVPLDPDGATWRHYAVVGLFDATDRQFIPPEDGRTAERPGGARGGSPPPIFNVAFRFDESAGVATVERFNPFAEEPGMEKQAIPYGAWREHDQAMALADRDISALHADIDFGRLSAGETDRGGQPTGYHNRLYASQFDLGEGVRREFVPFSGQRPSDDRSSYDLLCNRIQPYACYVPESDDPDEPAPLHVHLHGGSASHNTLRPDGNFLAQVGEDRGAIVVAPLGRGPGVFYQRAGELDVLEVIADVSRHYAVDPDRVTIGGTSMGGFGTFKLASRYPDLFAKAVPVVGSHWPGPEELLDSLRHVPVLLWNGLQDALATPREFLPAHVGLQQREYPHELDMFLRDGHLDARERDEWGPIRAFLDGDVLGPATVTREPARVTYTRLPALEHAPLDLRHDGAYWIGDVAVADGADAGFVDARSGARGGEGDVEHYSDLGTDPAEHVVLGTRRREGGAEDADGEAATEPANALAVTLEGVSGLTVDVAGAGLDGDAPIDVEVTTTDPATIAFVAGDERTDVSVAAGESSRTVTV